MKRGNSKIYKRFIISFLVVLILPTIFFVILLFDNFKEIYQDKIVKQAQKSLEVSVLELERNIENFNAIVSYNTFLPQMQDYVIKNDVLGDDVEALLLAEVSSHLILDNLCYYNEIKPQCIYTVNGTYNLKYFARLQYGMDEQEFIKLLYSIENQEWNIKTSSSSEEGNLQYIIRTKYGEWWFFQISRRYLDNILKEKDADTVLVDENELLLHAIEQRTANKNSELASAKTSNKEYHELYASSSTGKFRVIRIIDSDHLFAEVDEWQNYCYLVLSLVLLIGGVLVVLLTTYNSNPIRELQSYCKEKILNIPSTIDGMDVFRFALKSMEDRMVLLEEKQKKNQLLLQMIYSRDSDTVEFQRSVEAMGLFRSTDKYRVVLASSVGDNETLCQKVKFYFDTIHKSGYEIHVLDIATKNVAVIIIGIENAEEENLEPFLQQTVEKLQREVNGEIVLFMGGTCERLNDVGKSYQEAITCCQDSDYRSCQGKNNLDRERIIKYRVTPLDTEFYYPEAELRTLYEALTEIDFEKANVMTDALIEILKKQNGNRFVYVSLYYDILNTYYKAQSMLDINMEEDFLDMDLLEVKYHVDVIQMVLRIRDQYRLYIEKVKAAQIVEPVIEKIIEYINENSSSSELSVSMVADYFNMSISNISHQFKAQTGHNISDYISEKKLHYASELLMNTDYSIQKIADLTGYSQASGFIRKFKKHYGITPAEYRNKEEQL